MSGESCVGFEHEMEDEDGFDSDDDWDEMDDDCNQVLVDCLFCSSTFQNIDVAVSHSCKDHGFDLSKLKSRHKMDCYSYIKLVNFARSERPTADHLMSCQQAIWSDNKYLMPVNPQDAWLMFDFDDVEECSTLEGQGAVIPCAGYHVNSEDGRVTLSETHFAELQRTIQSLNAQLKEKDEVVSQLMSDMQRMKVTLGEVVVSESNLGPAASGLSRNVANIRLEEDEEYFNTYAHFGIHYEMLSDEVRTLSYLEAFQLNSSKFSGSTVLDVGCGTGILSMFATKAGASKVIGVDQSDIIYHAMDIIRENGLTDRVELIKGRVEDVELPVAGVDVIVSEWMGYFLLFEAMLDSVIWARDRLLKPGGTLLPNRCSISLLGADDQDLHINMVGFWSNVYGFKMSSLRSDVVCEPRTCVVASKHVATTHAMLCQLDLMTVDTSCMDFASDFALTATKTTQLTCLVGYFDVFFDLPKKVEFSTGPESKTTHWKQTVFLIKDPLQVKQGDVIQGRLECKRNRKEVRSLIVTITLANVKQRYLLS